MVAGVLQAAIHAAGRRSRVEDEGTGAHKRVSIHSKMLDKRLDWLGGAWEGHSTCELEITAKLRPCSAEEDAAPARHAPGWLGWGLRLTLARLAGEAAGARMCRSGDVALLTGAFRGCSMLSPVGAQGQ